MNRLIESPVNNNLVATSRSLRLNHPSNENLYTSTETFKELIAEVKIRFDTNPKFYLREDFNKLCALLEKLSEAHEIVDLSLVDKWELVVRRNTLPDGDLIKETIVNLQERVDSIPQYLEGTGIDITDDIISSNTEATTVNSIVCSTGAPIDATGIWENNTIPTGTSVLEILEKLLNREIFPSIATLPDFTIFGTSFEIKEIGASVSISDPSTTKSNGRFNASFSSPVLPTVLGVIWSNEEMSSITNSGFVGEDTTRTISLGLNKITYTFTKNYSAPTNMPITNLGNPTQSTSKISVDGSDMTAIWDSGTITKNFEITATGVYPCYTNISNNSLIDNIDNKCDLTSGNTVVIENVPSEVINNKHFKFAFPADRQVTFLIKDLSGNFVSFDSAYTITETTINNVSYNVITTVGDGLGINTYKFVLSKNLSE